VRTRGATTSLGVCFNDAKEVKLLQVVVVWRMGFYWGFAHSVAAKNKMEKIPFLF
jgi:hypothetical protein